MKFLISSTFLIYFTILSFLLTPSRPNEIGISVELIHKDSPLSPYHNPILTPYNRLHNEFKLSKNCLDRKISAYSNKVSSEINSSCGGYLMKLALGTPRFTVYAVADTGSDLVWTQCAPCTHCFEQTAPLFDPRKSFTYKVTTCHSKACERFGSTCDKSNQTCAYSIGYGDASFSEGNLASDTLGLGSKGNFPRFTFGCGYKNGGTFNKNDAGIVGLGRGSISLISQLSSFIHGKFSYCLPPLFSNITSELKFGNIALVPGKSTPIVQVPYEDTFYWLTLKAISVGKRRLHMKDSNPGGNTIIDSGTTLTILPDSSYSQLESSVKELMGNKTVKDPLGELSLCYRISNNPLIPPISLHFTGVTIDLKPINAFVQTGDDVTCLAFSGGDNPFTIFGNIAQSNFLVGYDIVQKTVSFKPKKCGM